MATTPEKRRKEMKRLEKQREKAERRTQRKIASRRQKELLAEWHQPRGRRSLDSKRGRTLRVGASRLIPQAGRTLLSQ